MSNDIYTEMIQPRGQEYRSDQIVSWSHYREPIDNSVGRAAGNSRVWGDANPETQSRVIDSLIASSQRAGLSPRETAYVLAIAREESGFNPDAAAGTTSAAGLGQFIDKTGRSYGLNNQNRFDLSMQSDALVRHFVENRDLARSRGQGEEYIYKYHHDGPSKDYGGLGLSRREIMPRLNEYETFVRKHLGQTQAQAQAHGKVTRLSKNDMNLEPRLAASVLARGARGTDVEHLQRALATLGYAGKDGQQLAADQNFGANTDHALRDFQRAHGIRVDGKAGPETQRALTQALRHPLVSEATHPAHGLYAAIGAKLPLGTDPKIVANVTMIAVENDITSVATLKSVDINADKHMVFLRGTNEANRARVDLQAPAPQLQESSAYLQSQLSKPLAIPTHAQMVSI